MAKYFNREKVIARVLQMVGNVQTPDSTEVTVLKSNANDDVTLAQGTTVPTDAETGYAKGCLFVDTNASAGAVLLVNEGDETSCDFNSVGASLPTGSVSSSEILDGTVSDLDLATANIETKDIRTATATVDGLTTGTLTAGSQYTTVTSSNAAHIVILPPAVVGTEVELFVGANGFELRTVAASNATINNVDSDGSQQAAIPANTLAKLKCVSATAWLLTAVNNLGAVVTAIVPD
jgi:hypothetical protein